MYGPVRWLVASDRTGTVASGRVYQGVEYQALQRQAMLEAERAAAAYRQRQWQEAHQHGPAIEGVEPPAGEGLEAGWEVGRW
jgi:hypothetical protein